MKPRRAICLHAILLLAILLCATAACAPAFARRVPDLRIPCGRIAAAPAIVSIFEFEASGNLVPRGDWTYTVARNVDAAVTARISGDVGRTFVDEDVEHTDVTFPDFRRWTSAALQEIAGKIAGTRPSPRHAVTEWRFPQSLTTWRAALRADLVLAVLFVDAYETAAPIAATTPATTAYGAAQTGIACLVSLDDGRIVWCETAAGPLGDLRVRQSAQDAVADPVGQVVTACVRP